MTSASASPDLPTTVGIVVVLSALVIVANIIVDCLYAVVDPQRGDEYANQSPDEVEPQLRGRGRDLMTAAEGVSWALQAPGVIERNHCFMTTGSRKAGRRPGTLDSRVPALWISNGTGRDGRERKDAPKLGWCWAGKRHTWLGFASAATRAGTSS